MSGSVAVVLATYNGERYLREQIESLFCQTRRPDLLLVSDGGSSDGTVPLCEALLQNGPIPYRILPSQKRLNVRENFERGLSEADTDLIFFCDQDDVWKPEKIEKTLDAMERTGAGLVFCNAEITDGELKSAEQNDLWQSIGYSQSERLRVIEPEDGAFLGELFRRDIVTGMTVCLTRALKEKALPFSPNAIHDSWIALAALFTCRIAGLNEKLVLYRQHGGNAVGTGESLLRRMGKGSGYRARLAERQGEWEDVKERTAMSPESRARVDGYLAYLSRRLAYLAGEKGRVARVDYQQYEGQPKMTALKDTVYRLYFRRREKA